MLAQRVSAGDGYPGPRARLPSAVGAADVSPARKRWGRGIQKTLSTGGAAHVPYIRPKRGPCRVQHQNRRKLIPAEFQPRIWAYAAGICKKQGILVHAVGGMEDHIHFLIQVPPPLALAKAVLAIKSNSSRWANEEGHKLAWQQGYAAFSVSASIVPAVVRYIRNQEAHHRRRGFDEEFLALLKKHGVEFDPKFVLG
ncbi:MAG: IS200/IS605 family transposase [Terriglobales bacterium]